MWLLSYHSAYPPDGGMQPGYTAHGTPGPRAEQLARRVTSVTGYPYLPDWPSEYTFTGELIHWCDLNGIWADDVELPHRGPLDVVLIDGSETALATHKRLINNLLAGFETDSSQSDEASYITYTVQPGDKLLGIALHFDVAMEEIARLNNIDDADQIMEGDELMVPVDGGP